jgi:hypothetical protein
MHRECCDDTCTSGSRNNYFPGKRLTPDSFRVEQKYLVDRRHLLNRAIHGWGVVYGYAVAVATADKRGAGAEPGMLEIGAGLALDKTGRELVQTATVALRLEDVILLDDKGAPVRAEGCDEKGRMSRVNADAAACWLLKVHYAEQSIGSVTLRDSCSCERTEWDQICETVRSSIQRVDCGECCVDQGCELNCGCAAGACCEQPDPGDDKLQIEHERLQQTYEQRLRDSRARGAPEDEIAKLKYEYEAELQSLVQRGWKPHEEHRHGRGGCRCLCDHLTGLEVGAGCDSLCEVDRCARVDLHNGVALACVKLGQDECGGWRFASVYDACGPRRLVKRNDLLFDLINGCDVTRIIDTGWKKWHRSRTPVPFEDFSAAFGPKAYDQAEYVTRDFWVRFSGPVRENTLRPDAFAMTVLGVDSEDGWWTPHRVPIVRIDTSAPREPGDPAGHVREARLVVDGAWLEDAIRGRANIFRVSEAEVEIKVRGDFIVDCNNQTLAANAHGLVAVPTGSDGPGDSYLSTFTVEKSQNPRQKTYGQPVEGAKS